MAAGCKRRRPADRQRDQCGGHDVNEYRQDGSTRSLPIASSVPRPCVALGTQIRSSCRRCLQIQSRSGRLGSTQCMTSSTPQLASLLCVSSSTSSCSSWPSSTSSSASSSPSSSSRSCHPKNVRSADYFGAIPPQFHLLLGVNRVERDGIHIQFWRASTHFSLFLLR